MSSLNFFLFRFLIPWKESEYSETRAWASGSKDLGTWISAPPHTGCVGLVSYQSSSQFPHLVVLSTLYNQGNWNGEWISEFSKATELTHVVRLRDRPSTHWLCFSLADCNAALVVALLGDSGEEDRTDKLWPKFILPLALGLQPSWSARWPSNFKPNP